VTDVCDVCALVDGDTSHKEVICCGVCSAHLCRGCSQRTTKNVLRRAQAWLLRGARGLPKRECGK
jgi:hypothetical protein